VGTAAGGAAVGGRSGAAILRGERLCDLVSRARQSLFQPSERCAGAVPAERPAGCPAAAAQSSRFGPPKNDPPRPRGWHEALHQPLRGGQADPGAGRGVGADQPELAPLAPALHAQGELPVAHAPAGDAGGWSRPSTRFATASCSRPAAWSRSRPSWPPSARAAATRTSCCFASRTSRRSPACGATEPWLQTGSSSGPAWPSPRLPPSGPASWLTLNPERTLTVSEREIVLGHIKALMG
jgi:hypothetical protein